MSIPDNILTLQANIQHALHRSPDPARHVTLLAVSKGQPLDAIRTAYHTGLRHFGENYWQEAQEKMNALKDIHDIIWYFLGTIQSNKAKHIAQHFEWVLSVHASSIADKLAQYRNPAQIPLNVCIEVNFFEESNKSGALQQDVMALAQHIIQKPRLRLRGLMLIPRPTADPDMQYRQYRAFAGFFNTLKPCMPPSFDTLSMGMSGDYHAAIQTGSTMVRIGEALFGSRRRT